MLTIIYYTSNKIPEVFAQRVRDHLFSLTEGNIDIVSVSQKPIDFGLNICVGDIGASIYNVYRQIFEGLKVTKTKYVAMAEDDTVYVMEHLNHRPPDNTIGYNMHKWHLDMRGLFVHRERMSMLGCIAPTETLYNVLDERFTKYPDPPDFTKYSGRQRKGFGEPGRYEHSLGLSTVAIERFRTIQPIISFNHGNGIGGVRPLVRADIRQESIEPWGSAKELWNKFYGD